MKAMGLVVVWVCVCEAAECCSAMQLTPLLLLVLAGS